MGRQAGRTAPVANTLAESDLHTDNTNIAICSLLHKFQHIGPQCTRRVVKAIFKRLVATHLNGFHNVRIPFLAKNPNCSFFELRWK